MREVFFRVLTVEVLKENKNRVDETVKLPISWKLEDVRERTNRLKS